MLNLFQDKINSNQQADFYKELKKEHYEEVRNIISNWSIGMELREEKNNTIMQFQSTFYSMFWEIYLNAVFKELEFSIDYQKETPDFFINKNNHFLNIEAVIANSSEYEIFNSPSHENIIKSLLTKTRDDVDNEAAFRLYNSIISKYKDYHRKHKTKEWVKDNPYIIAISPNMGADPSRSNNTAINKVLFGIESNFNVDENGVPYQDQINSLHNNNKNKDIEMGIFTNDKYSDISAIIYSNVAGLGKAISLTDLDFVVNYRNFFNKEIESYNLNIPEYALFTTFNSPFGGGSIEVTCLNSDYNENILDGLHIYYNPFAKHPLNQDLFESIHITSNVFDRKNKTPLSNHPDGSLINRIINPPLDYKSKNYFDYILTLKNNNIL